MSLRVVDREGPLSLRVARDADSAKMIRLVGEVLQEYGETICLSPGGAEADLQEIERSYLDAGGCFWVLETHRNSNQAIVGTHAAVLDPRDSRKCILKRLYLSREFRGSGNGDRLMQAAIDWAIDQQCERIEFWSDTRFKRAHRFFARLGFIASGETRQMHDSHVPYQEYHFRMELR